MTEGPNVYQRIHKVMQELSFIAKGDKKVNGMYAYVSHDAVTAAVREQAVKHGLVIYADVLSHETTGNTTVVTVELNVVNIDNPTDRLVTKAFGYGVDPSDKGPGKSVSYAVKMAMLKTFCLETGEADIEKDDIKRDAPAGFAPKFSGGGLKKS